jgi:hypothetical protein
VRQPVRETASSTATICEGGGWQAGVAAPWFETTATQEDLMKVGIPREVKNNE